MKWKDVVRYAMAKERERFAFWVVDFTKYITIFIYDKKELHNFFLYPNGEVYDAVSDAWIYKGDKAISYERMLEFIDTEWQNYKGQVKIGEQLELF